MLFFIFLVWHSAGREDGAAFPLQGGKRRQARGRSLRAEVVAKTTTGCVPQRVPRLLVGPNSNRCWAGFRNPFGILIRSRQNLCVMIGPRGENLASALERSPGSDFFQRGKREFPHLEGEGAGLHPALHPLPARNEWARNEGRGNQSGRASSSLQPAPPSNGGAGESAEVEAALHPPTLAAKKIDAARRTWHKDGHDRPEFFPCEK